MLKDFLPRLVRALKQPSTYVGLSLIMTGLFVTPDAATIANGLTTVMVGLGLVAVDA